jgi:crotonobetainyl-CoA:carnitine CoA-transferase CaiB-like acyl-CoA transferase
MLSPYRVIDLSDEGGQFCGQILGDLGADVILVEPLIYKIKDHGRQTA